MLESKFLLDNIQNIQQLMNIPALRKFETAKLGQLLKLSKIRQYEDGECIIQDGERDPWLYFLLSGKVRVEKDGVAIAAIDEVGEILGELRLIDSLSRSASVFAEGNTMCLAVDTTATDRLVPNDNRANLLLNLYRMCAEFISMRLRLTNEELVKSKKEIDRLLKEK